eukprot:TRINITY_DN1378_c0_g1_i2.p1 TRINITY_DN1378_c0_g1~~TRINITY_DN1378_c0_g1_i2.p1  ORF type:complete len:490 (+),score=83.20 TRINITY_DN1378_c0_g1_i2:164-1633(+)
MPCSKALGPELEHADGIVLDVNELTQPKQDSPPSPPSQPSSGDGSQDDSPSNSIPRMDLQMEGLDFHPGDEVPSSDEESATGSVPRRAGVFELVTGTMPDAALWVEWHSWVCFVDSCLRGLAQVIFLNNPLTGVCVLVAAGVCDGYLLVYGVAGVVTSTGTAVLIGVESSSIRAGLMGYNGWLTGVAVALFQYGSSDEWQGWMALYVVFAAACSTLFQVSLGQLLVPSLGVPPLTLPFHLAAWMCLLAAQSASYLPNADGTLTPALVTPRTWAGRSSLDWDVSDSVEGVFKGVGQAFMLENTWSGVILIAGACISSRITAANALLGALFGNLVAMAMGISQELVYRGLYGYNACVVAAALNGMFTVLSVKSMIFTAAACAFTTVLTAGLANALSPTGMPALTFPAAFSIIFFLLLFKPIANAPTSVALTSMTVPEEHLNLDRAADPPPSPKIVCDHPGHTDSDLTLSQNDVRKRKHDSESDYSEHLVVL